MLFLLFVVELPLLNSFVDALIYNLVFGLFAISFWHLTKNSNLLSNRTIEIIINHISLGIISIALWLHLSSFILGQIFENDPDYLIFLSKSFGNRIFIGVGYYLLITLFFYLFQTIQRLKEKNDYEAIITKQLKESELQALRSQINPHFLFNSLNSINSLTISNPEKASEMIIKLSEYMRYSLNFNDTKLISLKEELLQIERYLDIEKIRFDKRLILDLKIDDDCLEMSLPPMLLQPLIENTIKHGLYGSIEGVEINLKVNKEDSCLNVLITNTYDPEYKSAKSNGIGLQNVKNRLLSIYGKSDILTVNNNKTLFEIQLKIPQYETL